MHGARNALARAAKRNTIAHVPSLVLRRCRLLGPTRSCAVIRDTMSATQTRCPRVQVGAVEAVGGQLDRFAEGMRADSAAQQASLRELLRGEAARGEEAVAEVLQPSNAGALASYVFGGSRAAEADMPIAKVRAAAVSIAPRQQRSQQARPASHNTTAEVALPVRVALCACDGWLCWQ